MTSQGFTALHTHAHAGDSTALRALLTSHDVRATTVKGDTALHLASLGGHHEAVSVLLGAQPAPDLNAVNASGWTPLMLAVLSGAPPNSRQACVNSLIAHGASAAPTAQGGWTAVLCASRRGDHTCLAALLSLSTPGLLGAITSEGDTALHLAAHAGSALCVRLLLAAGVDADVFNARGLDAAALCVHAACRTDEHADISDRATAAFEEILVRLAAAAAQPPPAPPAGAPEATATAPPVSRSAGWGALHGNLLHRLAGAPPAVGLPRVLGLCAVLRRCGCHDASEPGRPPAERPSALAAQMGRPALASLLRSPQPSPACLLCVRVPLERPAPRVIHLHEGGAVGAPHLASEPTRLRRATLTAMRPPEEAHRSAEQLAQNGAAAMAAIERLAEQGVLTALGGGVVERWRRYQLAGELPADILALGSHDPHMTTHVRKVPRRLRS